MGVRINHQYEWQCDRCHAIGFQNFPVAWRSTPLQPTPPPGWLVYEGLDTYDLVVVCPECPGVVIASKRKPP